MQHPTFRQPFITSLFGYDEFLMRGMFFFFLPVVILLLLGGQLDSALSAPKNVVVNEVALSGQHLPSIALGPDSQI
jgi:hypothetical protein